MSERCDLLLYVQHLLGIGHFKRAALIAREAARAGLKVTVATGGLPVPDADFGGARVVQLEPALRTKDQAFSALVLEDGSQLGEQEKARRTQQLLSLFQAEQPAVLLTEMFPFGRRQMRFELLPLLQAAKAAAWRPKIVSSVRDILTTLKQPGKIAWIVETADHFYDCVLVHGDPALIPFERTFPEITAIGAEIRYTGYIVDSKIPPRAALAKGEFLISTGGGAVAEPLVRAVLEAYPLSPYRDRLWRVLIGYNLPDERFQALAAEAPGGVLIERSRPDFLTLLSKAALSISQAGYNTSLEVLAAGVPAVVVPFAAGGESEQTLRARLLADAGRLVLAEEAGLTGARLNDAIERAFALSTTAGREQGLRVGRAPVSLDGAAETARQLAALAGREVREGEGC